MSEQLSTNLSGVTETLLITLYIRAMETQRPDALIKDVQAVALMKKISDAGLYDFRGMKSLRLSEENRLVIILRNREFDRLARDFLRRNPEAVVVHIGCGLDTRFERVDNGRVEWFDLDLPEVIELRRNSWAIRWAVVICWAARYTKSHGWTRHVRMCNDPSCSWPKACSCTSQKSKSSGWC